MCHAAPCVRDADGDQRGLIKPIFPGEPGRDAIGAQAASANQATSEMRVAIRTGFCGTRCFPVAVRGVQTEAMTVPFRSLRMCASMGPFCRSGGVCLLGPETRSSPERTEIHMKPDRYNPRLWSSRRACE